MDITPCKYYEPINVNNLKQSKNKQHLNSIHLNIRSIYSHLDELKTLLTLCHSTKFDLIALTETKQTKTIYKLQTQILRDMYQNLV